MHKNKKTLQNHETDLWQVLHETQMTSDILYHLQVIFQNQIDRVVSIGHRTINVKWQPYNLEKLFLVSVVFQEPA